MSGGQQDRGLAGRARASEQQGLGESTETYAEGPPYPRTVVRVTANYPLWKLFLTMLELFAWMLIVLVVWVIFSILRGHDLSAWAKVGWLIFVIVLPFIWRVHLSDRPRRAPGRRAGRDSQRPPG